MIPDEFVSPGAMEEAIERRAIDWKESRNLPPLLKRILTRGAPMVDGPSSGEILTAGDESPLQAALRIVPRLKDSALIIQGPPGCGKTYTGSHVIAELLNEGRNVGIVSNSHKAIINLLRATGKVVGGDFRAIYPGKDKNDPLFVEFPGIIRAASGSKGAEAYVDGLIAGTAWLFSRADMEDRLDYLFVDEAGQVSLANLVAMSACARNIVLLGDQMQLAQPIQGSHPGETGSSALEYMLGEHATMPPDRGIFLGTSYRMHPQVCSFISEIVYEGRLHAAENNELQVLTLPENASLLKTNSGILFTPPPHTGNTQASEEEADAIAQITDELLLSRFTDKKGEKLLETKRKENPSRWVKGTVRNCQPSGQVNLYPINNRTLEKYQKNVA